MGFLTGTGRVGLSFDDVSPSGGATVGGSGVGCYFSPVSLHSPTGGVLVGGSGVGYSYYLTVHYGHHAPSGGLRVVPKPTQKTTLFIGGSSASTSGLYLFLAARGSCSGGLSMTVDGLGGDSGSASLFVDGANNNSLFATAQLFIKTYWTSSSGLSLATWGYAGDQPDPGMTGRLADPLGDACSVLGRMVLGYDNKAHSNESSLFVFGGNGSGMYDVAPLYTVSYATDFAPVELSTWGYSGDPTSLYTGNIGLGGRSYLQNIVLGYKGYGLAGVKSTNLFVRGIGPGPWNFNAGDEPTFTLDVWGKEAAASHTTLFVGLTPARSMRLFLCADDVPTVLSTTTLSLTGGRLFGGSGMIGPTTLFAYADDNANISSGCLPLFLDTATLDRTVRNVNLWILGQTKAAADSTTLFIENLQSGVADAATLFVQGDGVTDGASPAHGAINLFLRRPPANAISLFAQGPGTVADSLSDLFVLGHGLLTRGVSMALPTVVGGSIYTSKLYTHGY